MPLRSKQHIDTLLQNVSVRYQPQGYIAQDIFPKVPVKKDTDLFRVYDREFRLPETARADGAEANEAKFGISTSSYALQKHAIKDHISDDAQDNYDLADLRAETTENLTDIILRRLEVTVANLFTSTNWSQNVSLSSAQQFNAATTTGNSPIPIFDTAMTTVLQQSGFPVNFGIMSRSTYIACKNNAQVLDRTKYTSSDMTVEMLKGLLDLPNLYISNGIYDTSKPGTASSMQEIWGDHSFVGYKPDSAGPKKPSSGYVFMKAKPMVRRWRVEERESEAIEVQMQFDPKIVASLSGFLIKDTLA